MRSSCINNKELNRRRFTIKTDYNNGIIAPPKLRETTNSHGFIVPMSEILTDGPLIVTDPK